MRDLPLGRNIKAIRVKKGMTKDELVAKMQLSGSRITRGTLPNIESGRRNIKASDLKILVSILEADYRSFLRNRGRERDVKGSGM